MTERSLLICAALSIAAHFVIARSLEELPARPKPKPPQRVTIQVVDVPRPPEPLPPEPAPEPEPKPAPTPTRVAAPRAQPRSRPVKSTITKAVPATTAAPSTTAVTVESSVDDEPVYSATLQSTSGGGSTAGPVGSTTGSGGTGTAPTGTPDVIPAFETTKMPLPQGECFGKYTDEARTAGVEGTVVLDLTVGEDGHTRDIRVTQGLPHGLSEAAVAALRECKFSPGEKAGKRVPVRIRGFKIQFVLDEAR